MGIVEHIDAYLDRAKKTENTKDSVDIITVAAMILYKNQRESDFMKENRKIGCLTDQEIAVFIEHKQKYPGYERAVRHMTECNSCRRRAIESEQLLTTESENVRTSRELVENTFAEARRMASSKTSFVLRNWKQLTIAASIIMVITAVLYQAVIKPGSSMPELFVVLDSGRVLSMVRNETDFINQNSTLFENGITALAEKSSKALKHINLKGTMDTAFRQRRLVNAGYVFFLMKNSTAAEVLSDQIRYDLAVTDIDSTQAVNLLRQGLFDRFYTDIRTLSKKDRDSFNAGYLLGQLMYADINGYLEKKIISKAEKELIAVPADGMLEYIKSLASGAGERGVLRERVKKSLLAM